ncbi:multidrug effflux MFS transporter [Colwellia psychrerythraea]|uniref:Bcr/CflA family efflux transporter n=1 Tax=Colwellia psychrerythraea TaxID=28229 RepID=A0A099L191_COLPS|nr:multidrug effflux MFS transporter [Colwellia psychrerythraea]KGJ95912.1 drug resistance transporter, Bcr/CflA subfamily [Colwellia psychrerythraea]
MKKQYLILMLVAMGCLAALSTDIYLPAMPAIADELDTNMAMVQITLALFFATFALGQLVYGPLSDNFGRRKVLLVGIGLFGCAALLCANSTSVEMLMLGRFLLGMGACAGAVSSFAICRDVYDKTELTKTIAIISATIGIAPLVAPPIGAMLNEFYGWQSIFYFLAIYAFMLFVWVLSSLPETNKTNLRSTQQVDNMGYLQMLTNVNYFPYIVVNASAFVALFAFIASSPVIFMGHWQLTEYQFSLLFAFNAVWMIVANSLLSVALNKYSTDTMLKWGYLVIIGAATVMLLSGDAAEFIAALINVDVSIVAIVLFSGLMGTVTMGIAIVLSSSMSLLLQGVKHQYGKVVALAGFVRFGCGFAITFAVSQMTIINVTVLASIMIMCGAICLLVMVFRNKSKAILA